MAGLILAVALTGLGGVCGITYMWRRAEANLSEAKKQREEAKKQSDEAKKQRDEAKKQQALAGKLAPGEKGRG